MKCKGRGFPQNKKENKINVHNYNYDWKATELMLTFIWQLRGNVQNNPFIFCRKSPNSTKQITETCIESTHYKYAEFNLILAWN